MKHPIQPLLTDARGVLRFKANGIVQHLLEHGGIDMNQLAMLYFTDEDRQQFAQLIGYSLGGYGGLSYVDQAAFEAAEAAAGAGPCGAELSTGAAAMGARPNSTVASLEGNSDAYVRIEVPGRGAAS